MKLKSWQGIKIKWESNRAKPCRFFHKWMLAFSTGHTDYFQCKKCGSRLVVQDIGGYQPINLKWVFGESDDHHTDLLYDPKAFLMLLGVDPDSRLTKLLEKGSQSKPTKKYTSIAAYFKDRLSGLKKHK
ncbi:hypothetical protein A6E13_16480 [Aliivibrio fischeri]|uniref:hypothetical protein n=1 Tax=Aliivibrio fischeri TaxID=668 RepID=UPI00080EDCE5|nr:hypothetical protein [Aliivibrio fischeri]OCH31818.1 hypothetical protein A6E13_16480 [Aliivibrio fischeri]